MPGRGRSLLAALVAACALMAIGPLGSAHAARGMEVAIEDEDVFVSQSYYDRERAFQNAEAIGASRMRVIVYWAKTLTRGAGASRPPAQPTYNYAPIDNLIDQAAKHGIRLHLDLSGPAPAFATGNGRIGPFRPIPARFAEFARDVAAHFKGRVDRYSIWNEPNYPAWISPQRQAGRIYRGLYQAGYAAIKAADPDAKVLIGETVPYDEPGIAIAPLEFLRDVTCVDENYRRKGGCDPLVTDGYAHHPYEFLNPPSYRYPGADNAPIGSLTRLTRALKRLARAGALRTPEGGSPDLYLTEFGYFTSGRRSLPEGRRARFLPQAFEVALRQPGVRSMLQYLLIVPPPQHAFNTGLIEMSGRKQRPYRTLAAWARRAIARGAIKRPEPFTPPRVPGSAPVTPPAPPPAPPAQPAPSPPPPPSGGGTAPQSSPPSCPLPPLPC